MYTAARYRRLPRGHTLLLVVIGSQLPDLIDKPLAWAFGVLPSGRMFAHSLVVALPVLSVGCVLAARRGWGRPAALFSMAYLSHIVGDFYRILWLGSEYYFYPNLFWPLLAANPDRQPSFAAHAPSSPAPVVVTIGVFLLVTMYIVLDLVRRPPPILE